MTKPVNMRKLKLPCRTPDSTSESFSCRLARASNPVGTTPNLSSLASGCFRTMCFGRNPLSGQQPEQMHGDGTSCQCFSQKTGDFPGVWGFSPSDPALSIHTCLKKGIKFIKLIKSKIDDFNLRLQVDSNSAGWWLPK